MDIEEFEKRMKPSAKRSRLEPFRSQIFELKAKGYADWQVRDWLAANGLEVSRQAVQQFIKKREQAQLVNVSINEKPAALPQETITPKKEVETDDDLEHLSPADQRRIKNERKGDKYFSPQTTNSVLNNIVKNKGENK